MWPKGTPERGGEVAWCTSALSGVGHGRFARQTEPGTLAICPKSLVGTCDTEEQLIAEVDMPRAISYG